MWFESLEASLLSFQQSFYPSQRPRFVCTTPRFRTSHRPRHMHPFTFSPGVPPTSSTVSSTHGVGNYVPLPNSHFAATHAPARPTLMCEDLALERNPAALPLQKIDLPRIRRVEGHLSHRREGVLKYRNYGDLESSAAQEHFPQVPKTVVADPPTETPAKQEGFLFVCDFFNKSKQAFWDLREADQIVCLHHRLKDRARFHRKVRQAKQRYTKQEALDYAHQKIQKSVDRVVKGHSDEDRRRIMEKYYAKRTKEWKRKHCKACRLCEKRNFYKQGYEYGDWDFWLLNANGERIMNPLDEMD